MSLLRENLFIHGCVKETPFKDEIVSYLTKAKKNK